VTDAVFSQGYADCYDLLYADKEYDRECDFLEAVFQRSRTRVETVLDIGCGTGGHAIRLARRGYRVVGVDRSPEMLEIARRKAEEATVDLRFECQDARRLELDQAFDAAVAMFAVMSYQTSDADLEAVCAGVRRLLRPGGVFCFDAWHGPGVLRDPPQPRFKQVSAEGRRVLRFTQPEIDVARNLVATRFHLLEIAGDRIVRELDECHWMRYLFPQEIDHLLEAAGFCDVSCWPFLAMGEPLDDRHWHLAVAARVP
jgi:SAM-dependent methyltransferase